MSKSTVHKDIQDRLSAFNRPLYLQVKAVLDENTAQRHIRGGIATRRKYKGGAVSCLLARVCTPFLSAPPPAGKRLPLRP